MDRELTPKDRFLRSLSRCTADANFMPAFYRRFIAKSDDIRLKFLYTDFQKQHRMLQRSLELVGHATAGEATALRELYERAETHDHHHLNIEPRFYDYWLEAVMETAAEFDPLWNPQIAEAWRQILGFAIHHMTRHY